MKIHYDNYDMGKSWEFFSNPGHTCGPLAAPDVLSNLGLAARSAFSVVVYAWRVDHNEEGSFFSLRTRWPMICGFDNMS